MAIFNLTDIPDDVLAAAALWVALGNDETPEMYAAHDGGKGESLRALGTQYDISHVAVAKRLEVAEHRIALVRERAERIMASREQTVSPAA